MHPTLSSFCCGALLANAVLSWFSRLEIIKLYAKIFKYLDISGPSLKWSVSKTSLPLKHQFHQFTQNLGQGILPRFFRHHSTARIPKRASWTASVSLCGPGLQRIHILWKLSWSNNLSQCAELWTGAAWLSGEVGASDLTNCKRLGTVNSKVGS